MSEIKRRNLNKSVTPSPPPKEFGKCLQDYKIFQELGRGAHSKVYAAKCRRTNKIYALKIINKTTVKKENLTNRLLNEIEVHHKLKSKRIVELYDFFEDDDNVYLVLEHCDNGELFTYTKSKGRLGEPEGARVFRQVCEGLQYLHSNGVLHRDLKLPNILLTDEYNIKIADFGCSVQLKDFDEERDTLCGTPNYISPEIIKGRPYGLTADLWSLGCILYALLVGQPPFECPNVQDTLLKVKSSKFHLPDYLSQMAKELIISLLADPPESRPSLNEILRHPFLKTTSLEENINHNNSNILILSTIQNSDNSSTHSSSSNESLSNSEKEKGNILTPEKDTSASFSRPLNSSKQNQGKPFQSAQEVYKKSHRIESRNRGEKDEAYRKRLSYEDRKSSTHHKHHNESKNQDSTNSSHKKSKPPNSYKKPTHRHRHSNNSKHKEPTKEDTSQDTFEEISEPNPHPLAEVSENTGHTSTSTHETKKHSTASTDTKSNTSRMSTSRHHKHHSHGKINSPHKHNTAVSSSRIHKSYSNNAREGRSHGNKENLSPHNQHSIRDTSSEPIDQPSVRVSFKPVRTIHLKPIYHNTLRGFIQIQNDSSLQLEIAKKTKIMSISPNGQKIKIGSKLIENCEVEYTLNNLPAKFHSIYKYASDFVEVLRSKTPKIIYKTSEVKCYLMENDPFYNFEIKFADKAKLVYQVSSSETLLTTKSGKKMRINPYDDYDDLDENYKLYIDSFFKYLKKCLEIERQIEHKQDRLVFPVQINGKSPNYEHVNP